MRDQARRLARHPAVFDWMYGSDNPPPPKIEKMYLQVLQECNWPNPHQSSATARSTEVTGPSGVKMLGPYDYVPPSYWYLDSSHGGAYGFNTETGPGPSPPPIETLRRMLPAEHLWPPDTWWEYHAGGGPFHDLKVFTDALDARYGAASSVEEYARKSQMMAYETHRAMFEAFGRNKYTSTGVIQWMLNNAWPSMIWHLYDWYLRPGGSYFGAKKACEPLHVQFSYDDRSIVIVNSYYKPFADLSVTANVYNLDMSSKFSKSMKVSVDPDSSTRVFTLPDIDGLSSTYFVNLKLEQADGSEVSRNFYWLSTAPETLDFEKSTWYLTPTQSYANFQALNTLPAAQLSVSSQDSTGSTIVTVTNKGKSLAFGVHLKLNKGNDEVLPILWEDNYFALMPGETRKITATYNPKDIGVRAPVIEVEAWNRQ
jgi:exo-1,4-beta-D-glucosaminidase